MVVLGLLLVLLAIAAGILAVYGLPAADAATVSWDLFGNQVSISPTTIFFVGVGSAIALALGLWLMGLGARRSARKRRELRELRHQQKQQDRVRDDRARTFTTTDRATERARDDRHGHDRVVTDERADGSTSWTDTTH